MILNKKYLLNLYHIIQNHFIMKHLKQLKLLLATAVLLGGMISCQKEEPFETDVSSQSETDFGKHN